MDGFLFKKYKTGDNGMLDSVENLNLPIKGRKLGGLQMVRDASSAPVLLFAWRAGQSTVHQDSVWITTVLPASFTWWLKISGNFAFSVSAMHQHFATVSQNQSRESALAPSRVHCDTKSRKWKNGRPDLLSVAVFAVAWKFPVYVPRFSTYRHCMIPTYCSKECQHDTGRKDVTSTAAQVGKNLLAHKKYLCSLMLIDK